MTGSSSAIDFWFVFFFFFFHTESHLLSATETIDNNRIIIVNASIKRFDLSPLQPQSDAIQGADAAFGWQDGSC